jgi:hypothetical protein
LYYATAIPAAAINDKLQAICNLGNQLLLLLLLLLEVANLRAVL